LYTLFYDAAEEGLPVMRPVFFADSDDERLREEQEAFLLGSDLLIVPRWADDAQLPEGIWREVSLVDGDMDDDYQVRVMLRGGTVLPAGEVIESTRDYSLKKLTLYVCFDEDGEAGGKLYHDAGDGYAYRNGEFALVEYSARQDGDEVVVEMERVGGDYPLGNDEVQVIVVMEDRFEEFDGAFADGVFRACLP
jgi:alpha-glucosidase